MPDTSDNSVTLRRAALAATVVGWMKSGGNRMRWDGLFADLEAQAEALANAERGAEIEERTRAEAGQLSLVDRLRPALGMPIKLRCLGGATLAGQVRQVGAEWLLLDEGSGREAAVVLGSVTSVAGLGRLSAVPNTMSQVESRLGVRHLLRAIARDRSVLRAQLLDGTIVDGTLDRVGADFVEIAAHAPGEVRRRGEVREVLLLAIGAIAVLRRDS
jgi:hypothetical protein